MAQQVFQVQDAKELEDFKSLAEFYREFFKEFVCSFKEGKEVSITYDIYPLQELDDDLDFDELHYARIIKEFERVLDLYAKEACTNLCVDVRIVEKDGLQRLYQSVDQFVKYSESLIS